MLTILTKLDIVNSYLHIALLNIISKQKEGSSQKSVKMFGDGGVKKKIKQG